MRLVRLRAGIAAASIVGVVTVGTVLPAAAGRGPSRPDVRPAAVSINRLDSQAGATRAAVRLRLTTVSTMPVVGGVVPGTSIETVVDFALAQQGKPYLFNTSGPDTFDCSGLTAAAYAAIGVQIPHQSAQQALKGLPIDWRTTPIIAGDLVFTSSVGDPAAIDHVGLALDSAHWVQATRPGDVVKTGNLPSADSIMAVRRIVQP